MGVPETDATVGLDEMKAIEWFAGLPLNAAIGIAVGYAIVMGFKWVLDYFTARAATNPEEALRADLMEAHKEVRREVQELRRELSEAYDKMRYMNTELNRIRENLSAIKVELHLLKVDYPGSEEVLHAVIKKLEAVGDYPVPVSPENK